MPTWATSIEAKQPAALPVGGARGGEGGTTGAAPERRAAVGTHRGVGPASPPLSP